MPFTVDLLTALNRKERFFLVAEALGKLSHSGLR
jgi:hypothetical protein